MKNTTDYWIKQAEESGKFSPSEIEVMKEVRDILSEISDSPSHALNRFGDIELNSSSSNGGRVRKGRS